MCIDLKYKDDKLVKADKAIKWKVFRLSDKRGTFMSPYYNLKWKVGVKKKQRIDLNDPNVGFHVYATRAIARDRVSKSELADDLCVRRVEVTGYRWSGVTGPTMRRCEVWGTCVILPTKKKS